MRPVSDLPGRRRPRADWVNVTGCGRFSSGSSQRLSKEFACPPLGVVRDRPRPAPRDESDVAAMRRELEGECWVVASNAANVVEHGCREERIVHRAQKKGRPPNSLKPRQRARPRIVVVRVRETVHGRRHGVVELVDRLSALESACVEKAGICQQLCARFLSQRAQEVAIVDP